MNEIYEGLENIIDFEYERERRADDDASTDWEEATNRKEKKAMNKKEFQLTIKAIRDELKKGAFPKAMMTGAQEARSTATVNCGYEYARDKGNIEWLINNVFDHELFKGFLRVNQATAHIEYVNGYAKQIRIHW